MYGMKKTTLYLPDELKEALAEMAAAEGRSEAAIIREALRSAVRARTRPRPRIPLTMRPLGDPYAAERVAARLDGFGTS